MKFDKILNDIASTFLVEMPIAMYPSDSTKDWDPKAPWPDHIEDPSGILSSIKTGPQKKGQKQLIVSKFIKAASDFFFQTEMREKGGRPQDIIINAKNAVYGDESSPDVYREMFEEIGEDIIDYLLPNGYNPAEDAGHMKDIANTQILVNIIKRYLESKNVETAFGINKSYAGFTTVKLIQILFGEFGQGKHAGSVNVNVDDTPARHLAKRNFTYKAKRGKAGTQDITPIDIHDTDIESKAFESKQVLQEMPIAMYPSDSTKDWDPQPSWSNNIQDPSGILSSIKTGPQKKGQKQLIVSKFIKAASDFFFQLENLNERGGKPQDIIICAKNAVYGDDSSLEIYREILDEIGEDIIDYLLPNGYNPAESASHMKGVANTQILLNIIKQYLQSKNVKTAYGINITNAGLTTGKLIQILFGEFKNGPYAGLININVADTPAGHLARRGFNFRNDTSKQKDSTPLDIHDTDLESKTFESKQVLQEMPFRPHPSVLKRYYGGDVSRGREMFIERVVENLLNSKHARINDEYNRRGSSLYHAGNTASIAFNKNINDITTENMKPILEAYLGAIYDVIFKDNKNPAKNAGWLKEEVKKAIIQSIDIISEKIKQINGIVPNNVEETFEAISDSSANLDYFARVVVNTAIESMAVLQESEDDAEESEEEQKKKQEEEDSEQIQQENNTSSNDDDDEEYDDDDDDTESSNFAYDQGLLDDEEEIEDENKIDDEADTTVQRLDRAGTDIASVFLRSLDAIEDEMNDEDEDWEDEEGDVEARDSEEDEWRREFRGRGLSRSDLEDEDNYDPSSDVFGRDYDQD
jgi:hypothetical protein